MRLGRRFRRVELELGAEGELIQEFGHQGRESTTKEARYSDGKISNERIGTLTNGLLRMSEGRSDEREHRWIAMNDELFNESSEALSETGQQVESNDKKSFIRLVSFLALGFVCL